jgi:pSer/pThr/pTyr-binding forkhead associated (FHA) protein
LQTAWYSPSGDDLYLDHFPALIGRAQHCNITVEADFVSRRHCQFIRKGGQVLVQDLESLNGTFVNGILATGPTPVRHGDEIQLGPMSFRVLIMPSNDAWAYRSDSTSIEMTKC